MAEYPCRLRNATTRPVEIHSKGKKVVVLNPGDFVEIEVADPALEQLERDGVLTRHALVIRPRASHEQIPASHRASKVLTNKDGKLTAQEQKGKRPRRKTKNNRVI